jgi:hypothetical protein
MSYREGGREGGRGQEGEAEGDGNWVAALRGLRLPVGTRVFVNEGSKGGGSGRHAFPFFGHLELPLWLPLRGEALRGATALAAVALVVAPVYRTPVGRAALVLLAIQVDGVAAAAVLVGNAKGTLSLLRRRSARRSR